MSEQILSVGIDIGTTSTHVAVSRLSFRNEAVANRVPRMIIDSRDIVYQSPIHFTPLTDDASIDGPGVAEIVRSEYAAANLSPGDITSGAVIITGETAKLRNASQVLHAISDLAGEFVAASAGPNLESILAARGSGAAQASKEKMCTICNLDIGGGTTNIAIYSCGNLIDTACLGIGGRFLRVTDDGKITHVSEYGETFLNATAKEIEVGDRLDEDMLQLLGNLVAEAIIQLFKRKPAQVSQRMLVTDDLSRRYTIDEWWLSGGVAHLVRNPPSDPLLYNDMGAYLAKGIQGSLEEREWNYHVPENAIRATVIGAGSHSLQLSGSTVSVSENILPLKNVPLLRPFTAHPEAMPDAQVLTQLVSSALQKHDLDWSSQPIALVLDSIQDVGFQSLDNWSMALAETFTRLRGSNPLLLLAVQDVALALGQLLKQRLMDAPIVVLDGIDSTLGDYIDIGQPVADRNALPVVVKSLIFSPYT